MCRSFGTCDTLDRAVAETLRRFEMTAVDTASPRVEHPAQTPQAAAKTATARMGSGLTVRSGGYLLAIAIGELADVNPPEICDAIRNAVTIAGTLINLRN